MEKTTNLGLSLPSETDLPHESVRMFRQDLGIIDASAGGMSTRVEKLESRTADNESALSVLDTRMASAESGLASEISRSDNGVKVIEVPDWVFDKSGYAEFTFSQLGIPTAGDTVYYPDVSVISGRLYFAQLVEITQTGFAIQIYYPDGTPGCDVEDDVVAGAKRSGEAVSGEHATESVVRLKMRFFIPLNIDTKQKATSFNTMNFNGINQSVTFETD